MEPSYQLPRRISDIIQEKQKGSDIICRASFEIYPVDFRHKDSAFQAVVFLCRYSGTVNDNEYAFRKCYARGCPHNLCPHVAQAVMIANRYLMRDYRKLRDAGIDMDESQVFTLDDMVVKFEEIKRDEQGPAFTIDDLVAMAQKGNEVHIDISLEYVPGVEHFANEKNAQTFLMGNFILSLEEKIYQTQRCFSCFPTDQESIEKPLSIKIANERLKGIYASFNEASVRYEPKFFE